jgi:hypothetical protein
MSKIRFPQPSGLSSRLTLFLWMLLTGTVMTMTTSAQLPQTVTIGNLTGTSNWFFGPIYRNTTNAGTLNFSRHAYIYTAAELGIPSGVRITKVEWFRNDGGTIVAPNTFNVWLNNTTDVSFPTTVPWSTLVNGATQTYQNSNLAFTIGNQSWFEAPFNVPGSDSFTYTGGSLQILTDWAKGGLQTGSGIRFFVQTAAGKSIGIASTTPMTGSNILQAATYGNARPAIRITYVPVPPCNGTPTAGATLSSVVTACAGQPFTLTVQNTIPGTGVTYQWQSADDLAFTTNLTPMGSGATQIATLTTAAKYYRCITSCAASGLTDISTPIFIPLSAHYDCYCQSAASSDADEDIFNVTFGSLNNSSNCTTLASGPGSIQQIYSNYKNLPPTDVERLSVVPFSVQIGTCLNIYPNRTAIYIDYNQNAIFEASEQVYTTPTAITGPHFESGTVTIPATALLGLTGMRVITIEQTAPINSACGIYSWGETEDYLINITQTTNCSGTPNPGNTVSNFANVCSGKNVQLSIQNLTTGQGVSYQWHNGSGPIAGATSFSYTSGPITSPSTFYCAVTCLNSGITTNSNPITIGLNSFIDCYCTSMAGGDADVDIFKFTFNGVLTTTDCNTVAPGPGSILGRYSNFYPLGSLTTLDLGATVPYIIETDDCDQAPYFSFGTAIWIDYNRNGSFADPGERVFFEPLTLEGPRNIIGNITIPCTASTGLTGMRVAVMESLAGSLLTPCVLYGFGETEDYIINIKKPDTCSLASNPPGNTISNSGTSFCTQGSFDLTFSNKCLFENFTYQWYEGNFPGTLIPGATSRNFTTPVISSTTTYYCSVSCGTATQISTPLTIQKINILPVTASTSTTYCTGGAPAVLTTTNTGNGNPVTYSYSPISGLSATTGNTVSATPAQTTTYTITATNGIGCTGTSTITIANTPLPVTLTASATEFCSPNGTPVTLSASGATTYAWSPVTGLTSGIGASVLASPSVTTTYVVTGTDTSGCSGTQSVTIIVSSGSSSTIVACDSYTWNGNTYTNSGVYTQTSINAAGCFQNDTLNLTIHPSTSSSSSITACDSYTWNGNTYTTSGIYTTTSLNANGCIQTNTLNLTVNYSSSSALSATACDSYTWNGVTYTLSGVYTQTSLNAAGCVNTATLTLTINYSTNTTTNITACDSYVWNGTTLTNSGIYTQTSINAAGCVQTDVLNLTINTSTNSSTTVTACDSYTWNGNTFTVSGIYTNTSLNANGCIQTDHLNLTVNNSSSSALTATACDSYTWNGVTYTITGVYTQTSLNAAGCVNTATLTLTINYSTNTTTNITACDSYVWNGTTLTTSGTYTFTTLNAAGCVQTDILNLTINSSTGSTINVTQCNSYTWQGNTYTTSGTYTATSLNASGCTQTDTLNLTISTVNCAISLDLKVYIEGYYTGAGLMSPVLLNQGESSDPLVADSLTIALHQATAPYAMVDSKIGILHTDGTLHVEFPGVTAGNYYIVTNHRNALQTWSANPVSMTSSTNYDFTNAANKAYGDNQKQVGPGVFALYSGELIVDANIDLIDLGVVEDDINAFEFGYQETDINGDGNVDLLDSPLIEDNINNFIFAQMP